LANDALVRNDFRPDNDDCDDATVVTIVVLIVGWFGGPPYWGPPQDFRQPRKTSLDILEERFAKGEIDKEEFEERRRVLGV
jgi:putative membrane protein